MLLVAHNPEAQAVECQIYDRGGVKSEQLAHHQAADNGNSQWAAKF
jgi:hypothetical protein